MLDKTNISFVDKRRGVVYDDIWNLLNSNVFSCISIENHEYNTFQGLLQRSKWKPVIEDILPIYKGMEWNHKEKKIIEPVFTPKMHQVSKTQFLNDVFSFFEKFSDKKIGVHLSGGLDSSIIIGLLNYFEIPFYLVGLTTSRYEFRTERKIQKILAEWTDSVLIDYEAHLPMSNLKQIPQHQYPEVDCLGTEAYSAIAIECEKLGIEILFSGDGGDNVFGDEISLNPNTCDWQPHVLYSQWQNDMVYSKHGVELISFYADETIMNNIYNLRLGHKEDIQKLWARNYFSDFLPKELVHYNYCGDFWGLYIDGLISSLPDVMDIFDFAYNQTSNPYFSKKEVNRLIGQDLYNAQKEMYQTIESRISIAVWVYSLLSNKK